MEIKDFRALISYFWTSPCYLYGLLLDGLVFPITLVLYILHKLYPHDIDSCFNHNVNKTPMLLIHEKNDLHFLWARFYLRKCFNVYSLTLEKQKSTVSPIIGVNGFNAVLEEKVNSIVQDYTKAQANDISLSKIIIVGFDIAGLSAAMFAESNPEFIQKVITINSPWTGIPILDYMFITSLRESQLQADSGFLSRIGASCIKNPMPYIFLGSNYDYWVPFHNSHPTGEYFLDCTSPTSSPPKKWQILGTPHCIYSHTKSHMASLYFHGIWKQIIHLCDEYKF